MDPVPRRRRPRRVASRRDSARSTVARTALAAFLAVAIAVGGATPSSAVPATPAERDTPSEMVAQLDVGAVPPDVAVGDQIEDRFVVSFRPDVGPTRAAHAIARTGVEVVSAPAASRSHAIVRGDAGAVDALRRDPAVESLEPDRVLGLDRGPAPAPVQAVPSRITATQSEPPWGLDRVDQRELPLSGTYTAPADGAGVIAYVIDDGIWRPHVDFDDRVLEGAALVGLDEPGEESTDSHPTCSTHGSHIAGTIGGVFAGLAKQVELVPVRVFDCEGRSSTSAVISALEWVRDNHPADSPGVVNLSFGGPASDLLDAAVDDVVAAGIAVAAAAGNENVDACSTSPARSPVAITVGSTTSTDARSGFSNTGPCLDLFAPGSSILSVDADDSSSGFASMSGTSMATPHVAGAAALLLSLEPGLEPAEVAARLVEQATTGVVSDAGDGSPDLLVYVDDLDASEPATSDPDDPDEPDEPDEPAAAPASEPVAPSNDDLAAASALPAGTGEVTGSNVGASAESGEPDHAGEPGGASVWWTITAPADGTLTLTTDGSGFDTLLAVYTGSSMSSLVEVAANDDAPGLGEQSRVTFEATEDTTYRVAVDGRLAAVGSIELGVTWEPAPPGFEGVGPVRVFDSRAGSRVLAGSVVQVPVAGVSGVPVDAGAVVLNVTVVEPVDAGFVSVFPCAGGGAGGGVPEVSNVNFGVGETVANAVVSQVGGSGSVCVFSSAEVDLLADVSGAFG